MYHLGFNTKLDSVAQASLFHGLLDLFLVCGCKLDKISTAKICEFVLRQVSSEAIRRVEGHPESSVGA